MLLWCPQQKQLIDQYKLFAVTEIQKFLHLRIVNTLFSDFFWKIMKHSGWNPIRRNKNIGTKKRGYSQKNQSVIPERSQNNLIYWERLINPVACPLEIKGHQITLLVEATKPGYVHTCTPSDIIGVVELIEQEHLEVIELVILRQPTKNKKYYDLFGVALQVMQILITSILELALFLKLHPLIWFSNGLTSSTLMGAKNCFLLDKEEYAHRYVRELYHKYSAPKDYFHSSVCMMKTTWILWD